MDNHGSLSQKVFRHKARQHLPSMQPVLEKRVGEAFNKEVHTKLKTKGDILMCLKSGYQLTSFTQAGQILMATAL